MLHKINYPDNMSIFVRFIDDNRCFELYQFQDTGQFNPILSLKIVMAAFLKPGSAVNIQTGS